MPKKRNSRVEKKYYIKKGSGEVWEVSYKVEIVYCRDGRWREIWVKIPYSEKPLKEYTEFDHSVFYPSLSDDDNNNNG